MRKFSNRDYDIKHHGALEQPDGSYLNSYGDITWYNEEGQCHREDGPGVIHPDGSVSRWWLNGIRYSFNRWCTELNKTDEEKMLLRLQYA
jgi:hypothetical protein